MIDKNHEIYKHKHICLVVDHYNPLGIVRSLGEVGILPIVILCEKKPRLVNRSKYIGELHIFDNIEEGLEFIVENYSNEVYKPFIYNGSDNVTLLLDKNYQTLKDKFFFTNGCGGIEKFLQKYHITKLAESCGLTIPKEELLKKGVLPSTLKYPIFTKAATSASGLSWKEQARKCDNETELNEFYNTLTADEVLVQEFIDKANELCIDGISINQGEQIFMPYACHYHRFVPGNFGNYMYFFPFRDVELIGKIEEVIRRAKFSGIFCVEFMVSKDDQNYFLEVNFRNSGWSYAFTYGGFNLPFRWALSTLQNKLYLEDFTPVERFDAMDEISDFVISVLNAKQVGIIQWLREFHRCKCSFYYNTKDKKPSLFQWWYMIKGYIVKKIMKS